MQAMSWYTIIKFSFEIKRVTRPHLTPVSYLRTPHRKISQNKIVINLFPLHYSTTSKEIKIETLRRSPYEFNRWQEAYGFGLLINRTVGCD